MLFMERGLRQRKKSMAMEEMILPGIADNRKQQLASLEWIRQMSMNENSVESLANHDVETKPHVIVL